jgi:hypothetical protein
MSSATQGVLAQYGLLAHKMQYFIDVDQQGEPESMQQL